MAGDAGGRMVASARNMLHDEQEGEREGEGERERGRERGRQIDHEGRLRKRVNTQDERVLRR